MQNHSELDDKIDELVRDVTAIGSRPKSEVRHRIKTLITNAQRKAVEEIFIHLIAGTKIETNPEEYAKLVQRALISYLEEERELALARYSKKPNES